MKTTRIHSIATNWKKNSMMGAFPFINKVVDDRLTRQRQIPSGDQTKQSRYLRIEFSDKMEDSSCPTENKCRKTVPECEAKSRKFRRRVRFRNQAVVRIVNEATKDQESNADVDGSRTAEVTETRIHMTR